jgi:hypothetical protein
MALAEKAQPDFSANLVALKVAKARGVRLEKVIWSAGCTKTERVLPRHTDPLNKATPTRATLHQARLKSSTVLNHEVLKGPKKRPTKERSILVDRAKRVCLKPTVFRFFVFCRSEKLKNQKIEKSQIRTNENFSKSRSVNSDVTTNREYGSTEPYSKRRTRLFSRPIAPRRSRASRLVQCTPAILHTFRHPMVGFRSCGGSHVKARPAH